MNGEQVLVLYLANVNNRLATNGALIQGSEQGVSSRQP